MSGSTVRLHVLRHGQAVHNLLEAQKAPGSGDDVFDPALTDLGRQQAIGAGVPSGLHGGVQFWVSPLKRCIETACLALPKTDFWHVYEDIRETAGEKVCDSRMKKSELTAWTSQHFKHVQRWDFGGIETEEDELLPKPRESAMQMAERVRSALARMFHLARERQIAQFAWVSHSAYLSMLFAVLDILPTKQRWLNNGQWHTVDLSADETMDHVTHRLAPFCRPGCSISAIPAAPVLGVSAEIDKFVLTEVNWRELGTIASDSKTCAEAALVCIRTFNGSLNELFATTEIRVPSVSVALFPLAVKKGDAESSAEFLHGLEIWQSKMDLAFKPTTPPKTPPCVFNARPSIRSVPSPATFPVAFERMGLTAFSDCLLIGSMRDGLVADEVLDSAVSTARAILARGAIYSVHLVFCEA